MTGNTGLDDQKFEERSEKERMWQEKRLLAALCVMNGMSFSQAASTVGDVSRQFPYVWSKKLLDKHPPNPDDGNGRCTYTLKEGYEGLLQSRRPGPAPGRCPKVDEIYDRVKEEKEKPFRKNIGALKIKVMAGIDASPKTVAKAVEKAGFGPVRPGHKSHSSRMCKEAPNQQWNIDFVEIGIDSATGGKVHSLSVTDDHSRYVFAADATLEATTNHVISVLERLFRIHGKPGSIHSDHGCQWCSLRTDLCRFDAWCLENGLVHDLSPVGVPQLNGKVERHHGNIRIEAELPETATVEEYRERLEGYRMFHNMERPHHSLGLRTPSEVYYKTYKASAPVDDLIRDAIELQPTME